MAKNEKEKIERRNEVGKREKRMKIKERAGMKIMKEEKREREIR